MHSSLKVKGDNACFCVNICICLHDGRRAWGGVECGSVCGKFKYSLEGLQLLDLLRRCCALIDNQASCIFSERG